MSLSPSDSISKGLAVTEENKLLESVQFPTEILECPVCRSVPEEHKKLFQCKNGHLICESCNARHRLNSVECSTCRTPMKVKIRNRLAETILQYVFRACPYKAIGCAEIVQSLHLQTHLNECRFRPLHFCKAIGYIECEYDAQNMGDPRKIMDHLTTTHMISVEPGNDVSYEFDSTAALNDEEEEQVVIKLMGSRSHRETGTFFIFLMRRGNDDSPTNGILTNAICISSSRAEARLYSAAFYFTSLTGASNEHKCVASWPTTWYKDCVTTTKDGASSSSSSSSASVSDTTIWKSAFQVPPQTLRLVQGEESKLKVLVRVKLKPEFML